MYRIKNIEDALLHLVGWRQGYTPETTIDDYLTQTESGLYFQGEHPLMTLENMSVVMPKGFHISHPTWENSAVYMDNEKVMHDSKIWRSKIDDNIGHAPAVDSAFWSESNSLSDYLETITRDAIATAVQKFANDKLIQGEGNNLLDRRAFYDGAGRIKDVINNRNYIVGYELEPARAMGMTVKIEKIAFQMIGASGKVKLYLFHSSKVDPMWSQEFNLQGNGSVEWFTIKDLYLPYMGDTNAGGSWYLCYDQSELPLGMEAINISKDWSSEPCGSCNKGDAQYWKMLTKYMRITPFKIPTPTDFATTPELWDISKNMSTCTICYGLNVETSISCDLTDFIISQRQAFQSVISKQVAASAMRILAMNPSVIVNRGAYNASRNDLLYEIDGNPSIGLRGLGAALADAYKALYVDTSGFDRICLPCNNHGVRYRNA